MKIYNVKPLIFDYVVRPSRVVLRKKFFWICFIHPRGVRTGIALFHFDKVSFMKHPNAHRIMQSRIGCICLAFLHYVFSNESSNCLHQKMHSHICYIFLIFLHCAVSNVSSDHLSARMQNHIGCILFSW